MIHIAEKRLNSHILYKFLILNEINHKNIEVLSQGNSLNTCLTSIGSNDNSPLIDKKFIEYFKLTNYYIVDSELIRFNDKEIEYSIILTGDVQTVGELRRLAIDKIPEKII